MDENLEGNMGLQYTIATLEKLYLEPDFLPNHKKAPEALEDSLKDLGISRADLWAFAGLVALTGCRCTPRVYVTTPSPSPA